MHGIGKEIFLDIFYFFRQEDMSQKIINFKMKGEYIYILKCNGDRIYI